MAKAGIFDLCYKITYWPVISLTQGRPFMESLTENKPLFYSLLVSGSVLFSLASGLLPDLSAYFELVEFPTEVSYTYL